MPIQRPIYALSVQVIVQPVAKLQTTVLLVEWATLISTKPVFLHVQRGRIRTHPPVLIAALLANTALAR
jgi:hypothetical protein